jgi:hypothetical protein
MRKSKMTWRFALRDESHGLAPGEYSKRRSWVGTGMTAAEIMRIGDNGGALSEAT